MKIFQLRDFIEQDNKTLYLSTWQRNFVWTTDKVLELFDTIMKKRECDYCDINDFIIGSYPPHVHDESLCYQINYRKPEVNKAHKKVGKKYLSQIRHIQDAQQRMTSTLFMLYGDYLIEKGKKYYLYFDIINQEFFFDNKDEFKRNCVKSSKLFGIFLNTNTSTIQKQEACEREGFQYDDVVEMVNHILQFDISIKHKSYRNIKEALDDFRRTNSGHQLTSYDLFIDKLVELVDDLEFDTFFEKAYKEVNQSIPVQLAYFNSTNILKGKHDFALNLMTYRSRPNENKTTLHHFPDYVFNGDEPCIENSPIDEDTIKDFRNRLSKFIKKLLNTTIEVTDGTRTWKTHLPYKHIFKSCRLPVVAILRHMGRNQGREIDARSNSALDKQAIRFLIHLICLNNRNHSKHTSSSIDLFKCNTLEDFAEVPLEIHIDEIPIETKLLLCASSLTNDTVYSKKGIFNDLDLVDKWSKVYRCGDDLLTNNISRETIEFLPSQNQRRNHKRFLDNRRDEINKRLITLLEEYNITVL